MDTFQSRDYCINKTVSANVSVSEMYTVKGGFLFF